MLDRYEVYSPKRKKKRNQLIARIIKIIIAVIIFYLIVSGFLLSSIVVESASMMPGVEIGERVFASPIPYGIFIPFVSTRLAGIQKPERGDLVALKPPYIDTDNPFATFFEPLLNFITFQQGSFFSDHAGKRLHTENIKRIIAIPGDTVRIDGFIASIRPKESEAFVKEDLMIKRLYTPFVKNDYFPQAWNKSFPFSGNMGEITLGDNEYFVLGDNRTESNDSRSWGPVRFSRIVAKVILRYWPFTKIASY
jgi:signal peptidase I